MNRAPRYSQSGVKTLVSAMNLPESAHAYAVTDTATGATRGVYATEQLAWAAVSRLSRPGMLLVLTILHPGRCGCPEMAA